MDASLLTNEELVLELVNRESFCGVLFIATGEPEKVKPGATIEGWRMYEKGLQNPIASLKLLLKKAEAQAREGD